jgi:hypothetical protein
MKDFIFNITKDVIAKSKDGTTGRCVIANAMRQSYPGELADPKVDYTGLSWRYNGKRYYTPHTKQTFDIATGFDAGKPISPTRIRVRKQKILERNCIVRGPLGFKRKPNSPVKKANPTKCKVERRKWPLAPIERIAHV